MRTTSIVSRPKFGQFGALATHRNTPVQPTIAEDDTFFNQSISTNNGEKKKSSKIHLHKVNKIPLQKSKRYSVSINRKSCRKSLEKNSYLTTAELSKLFTYT